MPLTLVAVHHHFEVDESGREWAQELPYYAEASGSPPEPGAYVRWDSVRGQTWYGSDLTPETARERVLALRDSGARAKAGPWFFIGGVTCERPWAPQRAGDWPAYLLMESDPWQMTFKWRSAPDDPGGVSRFLRDNPKSRQALTELRDSLTAWLDGQGGQ